MVRFQKGREDWNLSVCLRGLLIGGPAQVPWQDMLRKENQRSALYGWQDLPMHILQSIFSLLPSCKSASEVCSHWRRAAVMTAQPILLRPVADSLPVVGLPIGMEILIPSCVRPRGSVLVSNTHNEDGPLFYRYIPVPSPSIDAELRFVGGSVGVPLFVNNRLRRLEVRRLITLPGGTGSSAQEIVLTIALPEGVQPSEVYLSCMAISSSHIGSRNWLPSGITSIILVTRSAFFGIKVEHQDTLTCVTPPWSSLGITEPLQVQSLEAQGQRRTFVSILLQKNADNGDSTAYYLLDASRRLALVRLYLTSRGTMLNLQELPVVVNELLKLDLRRTWLLYLPRWDHLGADVVCLAYEKSEQKSNGRFVAYTLDEGGDRNWVERNSVGANFCVFLGWGDAAEAFGFQCPVRMRLRNGQIYDCRSHLMSYRLRWTYPDVFGVLPPKTSLVWPFPLWIDLAFPASVALEGFSADEKVQEGLAGEEVQD